MLRAFKEGVEQFVNITGDRYKVSIDGKITDVLEEAIIEPDINGFVKIIVLGEKLRIKQELVIAMGYKPLYNAKDFWF